MGAQNNPIRAVTTRAWHVEFVTASRSPKVAWRPRRYWHRQKREGQSRNAWAMKWLRWLCRLTALHPIPDSDRDAPSAKVSGLRIKAPRDGGATIRAVPVGGQPVLPDLVPVAHDQRRPAARAKGGIALLIVDIAGIDILQTFAQGDIPGAYQGAHRRGRNVRHLVIRVERRKMQRHIHAELLSDPLAHGGDFLIRVVLTGNQQGGNFKPYVCFMLEIAQGIEHRLQL